MLSLFLSPFVVLNIMASYVSLNVVESETFQNKRNEEVGMGVFWIWKQILMLTKKPEKLERRRTSIYPLFKATSLFYRGDWRYRLIFSFFNETCSSWLFHVCWYFETVSLNMHAHDNIFFWFVLWKRILRVYPTSLNLTGFWKCF